MSKGRQIRITINGETKSLREWSEVEGACCYNTIVSRYRSGWGNYECVFMSTQDRGRKMENKNKGVVEKVNKFLLQNKINIEFEFPFSLTAINRDWKEVASYPINNLSDGWFNNRA